MKCPKCGAATTVSETRTGFDEVVNKRRRECTHCGNKFSTYEIDEGLEKTLKKYLDAHVKAVLKQRALTQRNERIEARLRAGEKHASIAADFGLSDNMVSTISRRLGIPAYQKTRKILKPKGPYKTIWQARQTEES